VDGLKSLNPEKLSVEYRDGLTNTTPIIPRAYTLTHSDTTGELFLTIGKGFAWDKVNLDTRDEVLGEWKRSCGSLFFQVYLFINDKYFDFAAAQKRDEIFRRELPLALTALRYGDRDLFRRYPYIDFVPIIVNFNSPFPQLAKQENWGFFHHYLIKNG
jgi:hypothetical protein